MNPPGVRSERGTALLAVLVLGALIGAVAVGLWGEAAFQRSSARRRCARARASWLARSAVQAAAGWFEEAERGALARPPRPEEVDSEGRLVDPDQDGEGFGWRTAEPPWNCRHKAYPGAVLFRPPDGPDPQDLFRGTGQGPDLVLVSTGKGARVLAGLESALDPEGGFTLARLAFFGPPAQSGPEVLATVEALVEVPLPGFLPVRSAVRGEVVRVEWGRADRPLVVAGEARFEGRSGWGLGEAVVGGAAIAGEETTALWPGGIPWLNPDRPLKEDADGDGAADDADADGRPDLRAWVEEPGAVADPWWRGRVGGTFNGIARGPCFQPFPFGPRASPPFRPSKTHERSGLFAACPPSGVPLPLPEDWLLLAKRGIRGAVEAFEDPARPGLFRSGLDDEPRHPGDLLPKAGGVCVLRAAPGGEGILELTLDGRRGAWLVDAPQVLIRAVEAGPGKIEVPGAPRDTGGEERAGGRADPFLELDPAGPEGWQPGSWRDPGEGEPPLARGSSEREPLHFEGWLGCSGHLVLPGPLVLQGAVRAGSLRAGGEGEVALLGLPEDQGDPARRPGPPGAPRIFVKNIRLAD